MSQFFPQVFDEAMMGWYNADLIDWDQEREQIIETAEAVAYSLYPRKMTKSELVCTLENALNHWGPEIIDELCESTSVPWCENEEMENLLKDILLRMLETAREAPDPLPESLRKAMFSGEM